MSFDVYINFNGECREAIEFYAKVFHSQVNGLMTFGQMASDPSIAIAQEDKDRVLYSSVPIYGCNVMFSDVPTGMPLVKGTNISLTLGTKDMDEIRRIFTELSDGGVVGMELQKTFWSDLYGMVTDKYGIIWQLSHDSSKE